MKYVIVLLIGFLFSFQAYAAELFLKVAEGGTLEVTVSDQVQKNSTGKFRFFDLESGNVKLKVKYGNSYSYLFDGTVRLHDGKRVIAELTLNGELIILNTTWCENETWCNSNSGYSSQNNQPTYGCNESAFNEMFAELKESGLDSKLLERSKMYAAKANFTSAQIKRICELYSFDSNRFEFAKYAYDYCADKGSYFIVSKTFSFTSNKNELEQYISNK